MEKRDLAQMLAFYAEEKKRHHFVYIKVEKSKVLTPEDDIALWANHASGAACTQIIKGKIVFGKEYLVSRGEELGFGLKPDVVCEYSSHWPYDFCYLYKL